MSNFLRNRYFDAKLDDKASGADSLRPGCISCELAEALGELTTGLYSVKY